MKTSARGMGQAEREEDDLPIGISTRCPLIWLSLSLTSASDMFESATCPVCVDRTWSASVVQDTWARNAP